MSAEARTRVRLLIQDNYTPQLLSDDQLDFLLQESGDDLYAAAVRACSILSVNRNLEPDRREAYRELAQELRHAYDVEGDASEFYSFQDGRPSAGTGANLGRFTLEGGELSYTNEEGQEYDLGRVEGDRGPPGERGLLDTPPALNCGHT